MKGNSPFLVHFKDTFEYYTFNNRQKSGAGIIVVVIFGKRVCIFH